MNWSISFLAASMLLIACSGNAPPNPAQAPTQGASQASAPASATTPQPGESWSPVTGTAPEKNEALRVAYLPATHDTLFFVALEEGFFKAFGLDVSAREFKNSPDALRAVEAGEVDIGIPGIAAPLYRIAAGAPLTVIGGEAWFSAGIVGPKDLLAQIPAGPGDAHALLSPFIGKKIGTVIQSTGDAILRAKVIEAQLSDQIQILNYESPAQLSAALDAGEVYAAMLWSPHMSRFEDGHPAFATVLWSSQLVQHPCCRQVCTLDVRKSREEALSRYMSGILVAKRFTQDPKNADKVISDVKKYVAGLSDDILRKELTVTDPRAQHHRTETSPNIAPDDTVKYAKMMAEAKLISADGPGRVSQSVDESLLTVAYQRVYGVAPEVAATCASQGLSDCDAVRGLQPRLGAGKP